MAWVQTALAVAGAVSSIAGGMSAKDDAEKAGKLQAEAILRQAKENKRRQLLELTQQKGRIDSIVYGSNLQMTGSSQRYKTFYDNEYRRGMQWDESKARMDARAARKGAGMVGDSAMYQGIGSAMGYAGQAASVWGK